MKSHKITGEKSGASLKLFSQLVQNLESPISNESIIVEPLESLPDQDDIYITQQQDGVNADEIYEKYSYIQHDHEVIEHDSYIYARSVFAKFVDGKPDVKPKSSDDKTVIGYSYS